jgi:hypothetical protein
MDLGDYKSGDRRFLLDIRIPEIELPIPQLIRKTNINFKLPFTYTGSALLSPQGQHLVRQMKDSTGRCLGGGVVSSRDLDWYANGMQGEQPGDYSPEKKLFRLSRQPQSLVDHEWIAFEYALMFNLNGGGGLLNSWDSIRLIEKVRTQGGDWHWKVQGKFAGKFEFLHGQANKHNVKTLMDIARAVGITVK